MDVETASAIERLTERVDGLETSLRAEMVALGDDLHQDLAALREDLTASQKNTRQEFVAVHESIADVRRHATILNESTREDIRFVTEAVANLAVKIDSLQR